MKITQKKVVYIDEKQKISFQKHLSNGIIVKSDCFILNDKFVEYQRSLFEDFFGQIAERLDQEEDTDIEKIKKQFEQELQEFNSKLLVYATKLKSENKTGIQGIVQVFLDTHYMASLIGDISLLIVRDHDITYMLNNGTDVKANIDTFADFIEGELETGDKIITLGCDTSIVMTDDDFRDINKLLKTEEQGIIEFLNELLLTRVSQEQIGFIVEETILYGNLQHHQTKGLQPIQENAKKKVEQITKNIFKNRLVVALSVFVVLFLVLLYNLFSSLTSITSNESDFLTTGGVIVDISIEDIKRDITLFQKLDPTSSDKMQKYNEIKGKISFLESKGKRLNDVAELKKILEIEYSKGFNIIVVEAIDQYNLLRFNQQEQQAIGTPLSIFYENDLMVAGTQGSIFRIVNEDIRGSLVRYGLPVPAITCSPSIIRTSLFCLLSSSELYHISRSVVEPIKTASQTFNPDLSQIGIYLRSNVYTLTRDKNLNGSGIYITRYKNVLGKVNELQEGANNQLRSDMISGFDFSAGFSSFAVDGTFLLWSIGDKSIYQFWREGTRADLNVRKVPVQGGDIAGQQLSSNVKIISQQGSAYVFLLDIDNQTFTVYTTNPAKNNDAYSSAFQMKYLMRLKFELKSEKIIDIAVSGVGKEEIYLLTTAGVAKMRLYEFIDTLK